MLVCVSQQVPHKLRHKQAGDSVVVGVRLHAELAADPTAADKAHCAGSIARYRCKADCVGIAPYYAHPTRVEPALAALSETALSASTQAAAAH
jgi:hypothetical protein